MPTKDYRNNLGGGGGGRTQGAMGIFGGGDIERDIWDTVTRGSVCPRGGVGGQKPTRPTQDKRMCPPLPPPTCPLPRAFFPAPQSAGKRRPRPLPRSHAPSTVAMGTAVAPATQTKDSGRGDVSGAERRRHGDTQCLPRARRRVAMGNGRTRDGAAWEQRDKPGITGPGPG